MTTCRYCGAEITWAINTTTGRRAPIDAEPADDGNIRLNGNTYDVLAATLADARAAGEPLHRNHFSTCPNPPAPRQRSHD